MGATIGERNWLTLPDHRSSPLVSSGVRVTRSSVYVFVLQIVACSSVLFLMAIVLSVLRFTDSDYSFGIFKLFLNVLDN